jgi:hypothetical protein
MRFGGQLKAETERSGLGSAGKQTIYHIAELGVTRAFGRVPN